MQVIDFILNNGYAALESALGIKVKEYDDVICLKYNQIDSPKTHPIVRECRGLILHKETLKVLCRPYERFFNWGEAPETIPDFSVKDLIAYEKVDGSLIKLWHHPVQGWRVGTSGTAYAESDCMGHGVTFEELVIKAAGQDTLEGFQSLCKDGQLEEDVTYLFELTCFENRIVTRYDGTQLHYLGARNNKTGEDVSFQQEMTATSVLGARQIGKYSFTTIEDCLNTAASLPDLQEGYVLHHPELDFRIKVKSPAYVAVHHIRGEGLNPKRAKQLVLTNEQDEYLRYFPEDEKHLTPTINKLIMLLLDLESAYHDNEHHESQKDFALAVKDYPFSSVLFQARNLGLTPQEAWSKLKESAKYNILTTYMGE